MRSSLGFGLGISRVNRGFGRLARFLVEHRLFDHVLEIGSVLRTNVDFDVVFVIDLTDFDQLEADQLEQRAERAHERFARWHVVEALHQPTQTDVAPGSKSMDDLIDVETQRARVGGDVMGSVGERLAHQPRKARQEVPDGELSEIELALGRSLVLLVESALRLARAFGVARFELLGRTAEAAVLEQALDQLVLGDRARSSSSISSRSAGASGS